MTDAQWRAATDSDPLLRSLVGIGNTGHRAERFGVACCRRIWDRLSDTAKEVVESMEAILDIEDRAAQYQSRVALQGAVYTKGFRARAGSADQAVERMYVRFYCPPTRVMGWPRALDALSEVSHLARKTVGKRGTARWAEEASAQAALLRDIFCHLTQMVMLPAWLSPTVVMLADQMYESREFSAIPILADALQEAGCDYDAILNHCRGPVPHVRGCWVVDLVLGKE